jgi:hypothetical protein
MPVAKVPDFSRECLRLSSVAVESQELDMLEGEKTPPVDRGAVRRRAQGWGFRSLLTGERIVQRREQDVRVRRGLDEGMAQEEQKRAMLPLKSSGGLADVRHILNLLEDLRSKQRVRPQEFEALIAIYQGRPQDAGPNEIKYLKDHDLLRADGHISPDVAAILDSGLEIRDNSYVLVQPFRLSSEQDRLIADQADEQNDRALIDLVLGRDRPGRSRG